MSGVAGWTTRQRWMYQISTESVAVARADVANFIAQTHHAKRVDDVRLMVSELITNAIVHARSPTTMVACANPALLRIEVADESTAPARAQVPGLSEPHGRGLMIVSALADAWGVEHQAIGKTVWFELRGSR